MQEYQVVKAKTPIEALAQSDWSEGDLAECSELQAVGNSDGTFTIFVSFEKPPKKEEVPKKLRSCHDRP